MATLPVRRENILPEYNYSLDPFQTVRDLMRWEPFADFYRPMQATGLNPQFDVKETNDAVVIKADVPGIAEKDLDIKLANNFLTVSGKRETEKEEKGDTSYRLERTFGSFTRSFALPSIVDVEHCQAELKGGVLTVHIPKTEKATARKIAITSEKTKA